MAASKAVRLAFSKFAYKNPHKWEWSAAAIPLLAPDTVRAATAKICIIVFYAVDC